MSATGVQHYIQRATDFFDGMRLMKDDEDYANSSALLAIHCAISYADALRVGLGEEKLTGEDHGQAVDSLKKLLRKRDVDGLGGINHLQSLIGKKNFVSYGSVSLTETDLIRLITSAERFSAWANRMGKQLDIGGWTHDDQ